jgi:hypothetical protein
MPGDDSGDASSTREAPSKKHADGGAGAATRATPRGRLALALGEAVRAGLETGDDSLVALAARTLAELLRTEG